MKTFKNREEFKKARSEERNKLLEKIIDTFSKIALAGHVFGSSARNSSDEFSDIDFWATFSDDKINEAINKRFETFKEIGEVLIYHEAQQNYPLGGTYSLLLFKTEVGPIHIDIYLSPIGSARLWGKSKILFSKTDLEIPKGEMVYETKRETRDMQDKVKFVICMAFSGIKKLVRKNDNKFLDFLVEIYNDLQQKSFPEMSIIENKNSFDTVEEILQNLSKITNKENKAVINDIQIFLNNIKILYS